MRSIITSDIHFGIPGKTDHSLWAARVIREYAHKNGIEVVLVLGDLYHDRQALNIGVLNGTYQFFDELDRDYNQEWVVFPGNHDMFLKNSWDVNSIKPLSRLVTIVEDIKRVDFGDTRFWVMPFVHYESAYMQVIESIQKQADPNDILLTHIGVKNASLNECFLVKHWSVVDFSDTIFKRVYAGHFHCKQQVGEKTFYCGSPIPFRFDEGLVDHGFFVYDSAKNDHEFVNIFKAGKELLPGLQRAPDYITCPDDVHSEADVDGNHVRVILSRDYTANELMDLRQDIVNRGALTVKWQKPKQKEDAIIQTQSKSSIGDGSKLFEKWIDHDQPKHLDKFNLAELNKQIVEEGEERISTQEDLDAEPATD